MITFCGGCYTIITSAPKCPNVVSEQIQSVDIGSTTGIDGQTCRVEETRRLTQYTTRDDLWHCVLKTHEKAIVRRVVCPNGKNGSSTVGVDGTKFHNEILE